MKTLEEIREAYKDETLDGRQTNRLAQFIHFKDLESWGLTPNEEVTEEQWEEHVVPFTRENVLKQLKADVEFGFEKALNQRGISSSLMFECVRFWNNVLEEGLENWSDDNYAMYGLPLFKATAVKYGWDNPIGDDTGTESIYGE